MNLVRFLCNFIITTTLAGLCGVAFFLWRFGTEAGIGPWYTVVTYGFVTFALANTPASLVLSFLWRKRDE